MKKCEMTYIDLINAFERWLETNYLPSSAQLLWYKLIAQFNKAGWCEWVTVDNQRLMSIMQISSEKTFIRCRDKLLDMGLFEYKKGKKGSPNQYKINTVNFTGQMTVKTTVKTTVNVSNINRLDKDIYLNLFNIYKAKIEKQPFYEKIKIISECKSSNEYTLLTHEEQEQLFIELMSIGTDRKN